MSPGKQRTQISSLMLLDHVKAIRLGINVIAVDEYDTMLVGFSVDID